MMGEEDRDKLVNANDTERGGGVNADSIKLERSVDEVVEEYVGQLGFSQILHVFLVSLAWIFDSQNTLVTIFTDAEPPPASWRCTSGSSSSWCGGGGGGGSATACELKPGTWEWIGGNTNSTIAEWGLVCDRKFLAAVPASLFFLGSMLGSAVCGQLADSILGRKRAVLVSCLLTSATGFLTSLTPNVWVYALLRFANGFARAGIGICCLVLSTEAVGRKWRGQVGQYSFFFFTAGFLSLPLIAYPARTNWRTIYRVLSVLPLLYSIFIIPFVSESPRWLLVRGRQEEALEVLRRHARLNGRKIPLNLCLSEPTNMISSDEEAGAGGQVVKSSTNANLWRTPWAAKRMITVMIAGFGLGFVYYGIQLNVENLNFNLYFAVALNAMMEIPSVFIGSVLLSFTDRRLLFSRSAYVAGVACIICTIFSRQVKADESTRSWSQLTFEAVAFMAASTAFDVIYIYSVELFPTNVRNFAVSMLRQTLMLGAAIAPLFVALGRISPAFSFLIFGLLSILSGLVSLWLPETRNAPLYETLEQQEAEESLNSISKGSQLELGR